MTGRWWGLLALWGCASSEVTITGIIFTTHDSEQGRAGATVTVHDEANAPWADAVTDDAGVFSVLAPRASFIHLGVEADGDVPLSFSGSSGVEDVFVVPDGVLYSMPQAEADAWRAQFAGCPGVDQPGMIVGVIRIQLSPDPQDDDANAPEINGFAYAEGDDAVRHEACYLDDDGVAYKADALVAGKTGRFAIFGVEGGPLRMGIGRRLNEESSVLTESFVYVPSGGAVSFQPAFVPL